MIDGLRTNRLSMITGCAFRQVTLRGDLGEFLIRASEDPGVDPIDRANLKLYEDVAEGVGRFRVREARFRDAVRRAAAALESRHVVRRARSHAGAPRRRRYVRRSTRERRVPRLGDDAGSVLR